MKKSCPICGSELSRKMAVALGANGSPMLHVLWNCGVGGAAFTRSELQAAGRPPLVDTPGVLAGCLGSFRGNECGGSPPSARGYRQADADLPAQIMNVAPPLASSVVCAGILRGQPGDLESLAMIPSILPAKLSEATPLLPHSPRSPRRREFLLNRQLVRPGFTRGQHNERGSSTKSPTTQQDHHPFDGYERGSPCIAEEDSRTAWS